MSNGSIFDTHWNDASEIEESYTRLSISALLSAFFGLGTFLVYFTHWFFFIGIMAILLSLFALWAVGRADGILTGKPLAYLGLCSAVIALVSVSVFWGTYQYQVRKESDQFFRLWFAAIQKEDIPQAKEYLGIYSVRSKAANADEWWKAQYGEKFAHRAVHQYVEDKLVRVLMAVGEKGKVSYYKTETIVSERETDTVVSIYAVSYPAESGGTETFFVRISGKRVYPPESTNFKAAGWRLEGSPTFYVPEEFKTKTNDANLASLPESMGIFWLWQVAESVK